MAYLFVVSQINNKSRVKLQQLFAPKSASICCNQTSPTIHSQIVNHIFWIYPGKACPSASVAAHTDLLVGIFGKSSVLMVITVLKAVAVFWTEIVSSGNFSKINKVARVKSFLADSAFQICFKRLLN